jgi:DNA adenine methylase
VGLKAPFPYFGGKRSVAADVWARFGRPKHYIEPFCGSAAMLLSAPSPASLEVVNDANGFIANFWRAVKYQPAAVAQWADYPVSHIDLGARHRWLMERREVFGAALHDPEWPGDAQVAGWWLWGQCSWIGSGWCEWDGKVPHVSNAGRGVQAIGQVPHVGDAGRGVQAIGKVPHVGNAGMGVQAIGKVPHVGNAGMGALLTSGGRTAWRWLHELADRLERVRVVHGDWNRCLNSHYGGKQTAVFLDPPYEGYGELYGATSIAAEVATWARDNADLRVAICGHVGDYDMPGWMVQQWSRDGNTYGSDKTKDAECIWYSPACINTEVGLPFEFEASA